MALYNSTSSASAVSASDVDTPPVNTDAVVTYSAIPGKSHVLGGVAWSYAGGTPTGNLKIEDGEGIIIFSIDITKDGAGFFPLDIAKRGSVNTAMILTLSAGGEGLTGKLSVLSHWTE